MPLGFPISKRAPNIQELNALYDWLYSNYYEKMDNILEFGCGVTSWVLYDALHPKKQVCVENFKPCVDAVKMHIPNINVIETSWHDIPRYEYDMLFVDGSSAPPKDIKPMSAKMPFRDDVVNYAKDMVKKEGIIILHDWNDKGGWRVAQTYLENKNYKLIWSYDFGHGWGVYTK